MSIGISGWNTTITQELFGLISNRERRSRISNRVVDSYHNRNVPSDFPTCDRYLFAQGLLAGKAVEDSVDPSEIYEVNLISVMQRVAAAFRRNDRARVVVIGSMSAILGSHDTHYAVAKAGLHSFVKVWSALPDRGQLNCVAPTIISDSRMTEARDDYPAVLKERRTVSARQVADLVYYLLYTDCGINRAVIEMTGDKI